MNESHYVPGAPHSGGVGHSTDHPAGQPRIAPAPGGLPKVSGMPTLVRQKDDLSSIAIDDAPAASDGAKQIRAFGVKEMTSDRNYKRQSNVTGHGAVHVKSFHGRLSDEGLQFVDDKINEWLEAHPQAEVKFATTTVGLYDGKIKDLALIVNVWY